MSSSGHNRSGSDKEPRCETAGAGNQAGVAPPEIPDLDGVLLEQFCNGHFLLAQHASPDRRFSGNDAPDATAGLAAGALLLRRGAVRNVALAREPENARRMLEIVDAKGVAHLSASPEQIDPPVLEQWRALAGCGFFSAEEQQPRPLVRFEYLVDPAVDPGAASAERTALKEMLDVPVRPRLRIPNASDVAPRAQANSCEDEAFNDCSDQNTCEDGLAANVCMSDDGSYMHLSNSCTGDTGNVCWPDSGSATNVCVYAESANTCDPSSRPEQRKLLRNAGRRQPQREPLHAAAEYVGAPSKRSKIPGTPEPVGAEEAS